MNSKPIFEVIKVCLYIFIILLSQHSFSQEEKIEKGKKYHLRSIVDLFTKEDTLKIKIPKSKTKLIAFPTLGYQPANGFTLGFIGQYSFKKEEENKISLISGGASYSTEKQLLTYLKNNMLVRLVTYNSFHR